MWIRLPEVAAAHAAPVYSVTDLGTLGGSGSAGYGVNNNGQVTGSSRIASGQGRGFLYDKTDGMIDIGALGGDFSTGRDINNLGQVTGAVVNGDGEQHGFGFDEVNGMTTFDTLGLNYSELTGAFSDGNSINDNGLVAGISTLNASNMQHAFLYDSLVGFTDLGVLARIIHGDAQVWMSRGSSAGLTGNF